MSDGESLQEKQEAVKRIMDNALEKEGLKPDLVPNVFREEMEGKPRLKFESKGDIKEQEELDRRRAFPNRGGIGGASESGELPKAREMREPKDDDGGVTPLR